jgi:tRNA-intron endonuclease
VKAVFDGATVRCGKDGQALYEQGGYGRREKDGLRLAPHEALYLLQRGKISVEGYGFDTLLAIYSRQPDVLRSYLVYRDIRERGYSVQTGPHDFRVFKRGQRPGKGESLYLVRVVTERDPIFFSGLIREVTTARNMRKLYILAAVDDDDELTYYEVKIQSLQDSVPGIVYPPVTGIPAGKSVMVRIPPGNEYQTSWFGSRLDEERVLLSPLETLHLVRSGALLVTGSNGDLTPDEVSLRAGEGDVEFASKFTVYTDLRNRGYIPKTGYKFGHHFRVYSGQKAHSEMLVHAVEQETRLPMSTISRSVRLAHSVKKKMLFGAVHSNGIQYVEFGRIKL